MKTALVLSAGGMYGAYQAGAWKTLAPVLQPDVVVGTSAGSLNGWAIAGGCTPQELIDVWLDPGMAALMRVRWHPSSWKGVFDPAPLEERVRHLYERFRPKTPYALTLTEIPRFRPRLVRDHEVTWRHMVASCSIPFGFPPVRIDGKLYVDGGLLDCMPLWAAAECGATRAIAINAMPVMPSRLVRAAARFAGAVGTRRPAPQSLEIFEVTPGRALGPIDDGIHWKEDNARRWIEMGAADAIPVAGRVASERALPLQ